jgi:hypothetical protein
MGRRVSWAAFAAVAVTLAPPLARADGKSACFDAAEHAELARHQGDLLAARKELLVCASGSSCPAAVRSDCTHWLDEVDAALPSIVLHARDAAGHDVIEARVLVDGVAMADRLGGTALSVNPGAHTIRIETADGAVSEEQIMAVEGQKERLVDVTVTAPSAPAGNPPAAPPPPAPAPQPATRSSRPWLLGGLAVVGVVGVGLATYFEVAGQDQYNNLKSGCGAKGTCSPSDVSSNKQMLYVLAPVSFGVGVVALGVAGALWLLNVPAADPSRAAAWRLDVGPTPGGGVAAITTAF